jgi:hypothetical protein
MLLTLGDGEIFNSSANDSNSQKNNNSGKSPRSTDSHGTTAGGGPALLPPFRVSLLSLLADFIDGSCNELRTELQTQMGVSDCSFSCVNPLIIISKTVLHSFIVIVLLSLT